MAAARGKEGARGEGRGSPRASQASRPQFYDPGKQEPHCFPHQCASPSPGGVGRSAAGLLAGDAWAAEPGISLQALTVSLLCGFLPVPTPHLCKSPGILLSPAVRRAKALDDEIDRDFPLQGCSAGTLNASLSLASQTPSPPGERTPWAGAGQQVHAWCKLAGVLSLVSFLFCKVVGFLFIRRVGQS